MSQDLEKEYQEEIKNISNASTKEGKTEFIEVGLEPKEVKFVEATEVKNTPQVTSRKYMQADESGVLSPSNIDEAYRYAKMICDSGVVPKHFDKPEKVLVAMQTAKELGLMPLTALRSMYVINGSVALFGDLPLSLVRRSGLLESFSEKQYDKDGNDLHESGSGADCEKAVCRLKRKGDSEEIVRTITWKEITAAGLDKDKWGDKATYKNFRKRMMQMRVRTWALKDGFSDVLMGIAVEEYDTYKADSAKEVGPSLNDRLGLTKNEEAL